AGALEAIGERLARRQSTAEGDRVGQLSVVEENRDRAARAVTMAVAKRAARGGRILVPLLPCALTGHPPALGLAPRASGVAHALSDQGLERVLIGRGLGEPQRLGVAAEAEAKIGQAPAHLRAPVALVHEGKDGVVVALRDGVAVAQSPAAHAIGFEDLAVGL